MKGKDTETILISGGFLLRSFFRENESLFSLSINGGHHHLFDFVTKSERHDRWNQSLKSTEVVVNAEEGIRRDMTPCVSFLSPKRRESVTISRSVTTGDDFFPILFQLLYFHHECQALTSSDFKTPDS
jgi:hypothetical protein